MVAEIIATVFVSQVVVLVVIFFSHFLVTAWEEFRDYHLLLFLWALVNFLVVIGGWIILSPIWGVL